MGNQQHGSKQRLYPPLLRINNSEQLQFKMRTLDRNYNFKEFCSLPSVSVDPNERNVFLEAGWMKMDGSRSNTYDVILMDKVCVKYSY